MNFFLQNTGSQIFPNLRILFHIRNHWQLSMHVLFAQPSPPLGNSSPAFHWKNETDLFFPATYPNPNYLNNYSMSKQGNQSEASPSLFFFPFPFLWNGWERCTLPLELEAVRTMWAGTPYSHLHSHTKKVFSTRKEWGQWRKRSRAQRRQERGLKLRLASKFSHYVIYLAYICDTILQICIRHIISLVYNAWCACRFVASS